MTMATAQASPDARSGWERSTSDWCFYFLEHLNEFARLVWYLVADTALVECVMIRAVTQLEGTPFDASDALLTYNQAHDTLIREAVSVLNLAQKRGLESDETFVGPVNPYELPDISRLAFLLKLVLRIPESGGSRTRTRRSPRQPRSEI
jgi:hypothetical protein